MRVYFLSSVPAALKLNGLYVGGIDMFERHIELDLDDRILAEIVPDYNLQSVNFFLDGAFFASPPDFADVYLLGDDALVHIRCYARKDGTVTVLRQERLGNCTVTLFRQCGLMLAAEGADCSLTPLPEAFCEAEFTTETLAGRQVLAVRGRGMLAVISEEGRAVYLNAADKAEFGERLKITADFKVCTAAYGVFEYDYDGHSLTLVSGKTEERRPPEREIAHFAFFESVLTCADFEKYLDGGLAPQADKIRGYLGGFVSVAVPTEKFCALHGNIPAAGLVYPKSKNLYEVKYFAVEYSGEKISNIYPVE